MKNKVARVASNSLHSVAKFFVSTASNFFFHQPEPPQELLKK